MLPKPVCRRRAVRHPALALALLSGCATAGSNVSPVACPELVAYSPAFQDRLADEVATLPAGAALITAMVDYGALRDQVRACRGAP